MFKCYCVYDLLHFSIQAKYNFCHMMTECISFNRLLSLVNLIDVSNGFSQLTFW